MRGVRKQKERVFIDVSDGSTSARLQVVVPTDLLNGYDQHVDYTKFMSNPK